MTRLSDLAKAGFDTIIDARSPSEYAEDHLPGAINIARGVLEFQVDAHPAVANAPAVTATGRAPTRGVRAVAARMPTQ